MYSTISSHPSGGQKLLAKTYHSELQFIADCVLRFPNLETGGDFFGFWSKDGEPVILYALGPGQQATGTGTSFFQDIGYLRECGTVLNSQFALEHIGAWHSHHQLGLYKPSSGDLQTMRNALSRSHPTRFLICICNIENGNSVAISPFLFAKDSAVDYSSCSVHILPGTNPIRDRMQGNNAILPLSPAQKASHHENPPYLLRPSEGSFNEKQSEKPQLSESSYWAKKEGQRLLKTVFDKLKAYQEIAQVELMQIADGRIAISFDHEGTEYEICFPDNFPSKSPYAMITGRRSRGFWKKNPQIDTVRQILESLNIFDSAQPIVILKPQ